MRVNPNDYNVVSQLQRGQFAYPGIFQNDNIGEDLQAPPSVPPLDLNSGTVKGMYTILSERGFDTYLPPWNPNLNEMLQEVFDSIRGFINMYQENPDDDLLIRIFILIHLWGGITGRNIFVKNGGFYSNFNITTYRNAVKIINNDPIKSLGKFLEIKNLGISASKHLHFWGENLPIYDNIISITLFGKYPTYKSVQQYTDYLNTLDNLIKQYWGLTRLSFERAIFNWVDTPAGQQWYNLRKTNA